MRLLAALLAIAAFALAGYSWQCLICYTVCAGVSSWLIHLFVSNKCELDFEIIFKVFEWMGYGTPHFLEGRAATSSINTPNEDTNECTIPEPIAKSVDKLIEHVAFDFVKSWYQEVADGDVFVMESKAALHKVSVEIYQRMTRLDSHYLTEQVILLFHAHLERFNKSVAVLKDKDPKLKLSISLTQLLHDTYESQIHSRHIALSSPVAELNYLRTVVDTLLSALVPPDIFSCDIGRFILREILAVQAVELLDLLTDPDWLNEAIIDLLSPPVRSKTGVLVKRKESDQKTMERAIKHCVGMNGNSTEIAKDLTANAEVGNAPGRSGRSKKERHISFEDQIYPTNEQVQDTKDVEERTNECLETTDNQISLERAEKTLPMGGNNIIQSNSSNNSVSGDTKPHAGSFVIIPNSCVRNDQETQVKPPGLTSSWGYCHSPEEQAFQTQSFEAMKQQALERERRENSPCCTTFEVSSEEVLDPNRKSSCLRVRSASLSELQLGASSEMEIKPGASFSTQRNTFQRSISFPNNMLSIIGCQEEPPLDRPVRFSTVHPTQVYGSPYHNLSFCSSDGSFKSFSDDDEDDLEEGEEMDEGSDSDSSEILENIAPLPILKAPRKSISRQAEVHIDNGGDIINGQSRWHYNDIRKRKHHHYQPLIVTTFPEGHLTSAGTNGRTSADHYSGDRNKSQNSKDSDSSDLRSPFDTTSPNSVKVESDSSFSDSVILAGKKFISTIKSPVRKFGFSSGSSKSTSTTSSGLDSMEVNVPSSIDNTSFDSDSPFYRPPTKTDSPCSGRKLSRCNAVMDVSSESESETWFGTPRASMKEEVVYGVASSFSGDTTDSDNKQVIKIHPSQLITIPSSETALESDLEPGRNKFTLYRIEYDIRIWPSVYKAVLEEESHEQELNIENEHEDNHKSVSSKRVIKRRYREFMELHSRLSNGPMALYMKDILKPNRKYNLPFGRLDKDVVEGRRRMLQYYLVSLVSKPVLRDSDELKQFLGVIGGVSFIKPSVTQIMSQSVHVPRVDKMLSRQMTKVIDTIKTAFDSEEDLEATQPHAVVDIDCPWSVVQHDRADDQQLLETDSQTAPGDYFSAFLENFEQFSHPFWPHISIDSDNSSDDSSDDDVDLLGPNSAGEDSGVPSESSAMSSLSKDDMLNGVLGTKSPGLVIPQSITHSVSTGSLKDHDTLDFGRYSPKRHRKVSPETFERKTFMAESIPLPRTESTESFNSHHKLANQLGFSKKNVEKLKQAAQKAKKKKAESAENLSHAKEKVKALQRKIPNPQKLLQKGHLPHFSHFEEKKDEVIVLDFPVEPTQSPVMPMKNEVPHGRPDQPLAMSGADEPSDRVSDIVNYMYPEDPQFPLSHSILNLTCEVLKGHNSWASLDRVQEGFLGGFGALFEWFVRSEIDDLFTDDCWGFYLHNLYEVLWPNGKLVEPSQENKSDEEKEKTKKEAVNTLMEFFPDLFPLLVGTRLYKECADNAVESLQTPAINRILIYVLLEVFLPELVPELQHTMYIEGQENIDHQ